MIIGRKYTMQGVHTGALLEKKLIELHISKAELGRRIKRSGSTILSFTRQPSIQTAVLTEICIALKYNFFNDIMDALPPELKETPAVAEPVISAEAIKDSVQLEWLRQENAYLKKMIDVLAKK